jgi:hypothetical protein
MVFIHPLILTDLADSNTVTSDRYNDMRNKQQQYNDQRDRIFIPKAEPLLPEINLAPVPAPEPVQEHKKTGLTKR